ncbi:MAG: hypothetical protein ABSB19_18900 [Methylomonas sp.]|jgi:hypothetical protein
MNKKNVIFFALCLVLLLALQIKFILPMMNRIAASDLFLAESKDLANPLPISNDMTAIAFSNCNAYIKNKVGEDSTLMFGEKPTNVWTLGNYEYIVNADVEITPKDAPGAMHHYVCRIQYENGDDLSGAANIDNWNMEGITGID